MSLSPPWRIGWDVPVNDASYKYCKEVLGLNCLCGLSLFDTPPSSWATMWALADKYDLYIILWALGNPAIREQVILANKDQPHLFGWFLWDEVDGDRTPQEQMVCHDEVRGYDPNHPTIMIWNWGETWNWEPDAFEILAWAMYSLSNPPPGAPDAPVIEVLHERMVTWYQRHLLIREAIALGKPFFPFMDCHSSVPYIPPTQPAPWCNSGPDGMGGRVITGERVFIDNNGNGVEQDFRKYNGMYGVQAMYLCWEELAGGPGSMSGVNFYNWQGGESPPHPCKVIINKQVRDLCHTYLGAPFPLSGTLTFSKSFTWKTAIIKIGKLLYGSVGFASSLAKGLKYPVSGNLRFSGPFGLTYTQLEALTWTQLQSYTWKSIGDRRLYIKFLQPKLTGVLSFAGDLSEDFSELIKKSLAGVLSFAGSLSHNFKLFIAGEIDPAGAIALKVKQALSGLINPSGWFLASTITLRACEKDWTFVQGLTWTQFQGYTWCRAILKAIHLGGSLSPTGVVPMKALSSFAGTLTSAGASIFKVKPILSGVLTSSGIFTSLHIKRLLSGSISPSSILKKLIKFPLSGVLSLAGSIFKGVNSLELLFRKLIDLIQTKD